MRSLFGAAALIAVSWFTPTAHAQSGGGFDISWSTIDCGAGTATFGGAFDISGVIGQPDVTYVESGNAELLGGFYAAECNGITLPYGNGCPGTGGLTPTYSITGCAESGRKITFSVQDGLPGGPVLLFFGLNQVAAPMGVGCTLYAGSLLPLILGPLPLNGNGGISFPVTVGAGVGGFQLFTQAFITDPGAPSKFTNTNAVRIQFG